MLMDKIKIHENLVWDKHTGELIGYVNLGDIELSYATLPKFNEITSHVMTFLVPSIVNPFKFNMVNFATKDIQASQIFPIICNAVKICELNSLKVIAVTCDGASANRKLFKMHFHLTFDDDIFLMLMSLIVLEIYLVCEKSDPFTLYMVYHIY